MFADERTLSPTGHDRGPADGEQLWLFDIACGDRVYPHYGYFTPPVDFHEMEDEYVASVYTDKYSQTQICVTVSRDMLTIKLTGGNAQTQERISDSCFNFGFLLPAKANGDSACIYRERGLLKVVINKR